MSKIRLVSAYELDGTLYHTQALAEADREMQEMFRRTRAGFMIGMLLGFFVGVALGALGVL